MLYGLKLLQPAGRKLIHTIIILEVGALVGQRVIAYRNSGPTGTGATDVVIGVRLQV